MAPDQPIPLATPQQMDQSTLRELIASLDADERADLMVRATRACESHCGGRRLAPFTGLVETHRAQGVDPTDAPPASPGDVGALAAAGYGRAAGGSGQVRQVWVDHFAPVYQDMWSYSNVTVLILRGDGSATVVPAADLLGGGIEADSGRLWFRTGTHLPVGSAVRVTYSGGYIPVPGDLVNACRYMAAADLIDEDSFPSGSSNTHDSKPGRGDGGFLSRAQRLLVPYGAPSDRAGR